MPPPILGQSITPSTKVKSLGVIFDTYMTMDAQIGSVVSRSHHLLRRLSPFIPKKDIAVVVGTLINFRLDYANALYLGPIYHSSASRSKYGRSTCDWEKNMGIHLTFVEIPFIGCP